MRAHTDHSKIRRQGQMSALLKREISEILTREVKDPRLRPFTVTEVQLKPDLKSAQVFVCRFKTTDEEPSQEERDDLMAGLKSASHFVYEQLKKRLRIKVIPSIRFQYDTQMLEAMKLWNITQHLKDEEKKDELS